MRLLTGTRGEIIKISDCDWSECSGIRWCIIGKGYVRSTTRPYIRLHRHILKPSKGMDVDHINGDTLDNRRENLRICTRSQNKMNGNLYKNNTSGYKGIYWNKRKEKWHIHLTVNQKDRHIGYYETLEEAINARNVAVKKFHGEFARID